MYEPPFTDLGKIYLIIYDETRCILEEVKITFKKLIYCLNHQNKWNASVV